MRNAVVQITQDFTNDHAAAAKALRLPLATPGSYGSPYLSVIDLMKRWPESTNRREVIMVTDGIDRARRGFRGPLSGINPDGSHYHDPGIRDISYFNGGDAIHAFPRASYGTPQSLGCVELPLAASAEIWPYTPIGTLVTIET